MAFCVIFILCFVTLALCSVGALGGTEESDPETLL